jgi:hypothetical protein
VFDRNGLPAWIAVEKVLTASFASFADLLGGLVAAGLIGPGGGRERQRTGADRRRF